MTNAARLLFLIKIKDRNLFLFLFPPRVLSIPAACSFVRKKNLFDCFFFLWGATRLSCYTDGIAVRDLLTSGCWCWLHASMNIIYRCHCLMYTRTIHSRRSEFCKCQGSCRKLTYRHVT